MKNIGYIKFVGFRFRRNIVSGQWNFPLLIYAFKIILYLFRSLTKRTPTCESALSRCTVLLSVVFDIVAKRTDYIIWKPMGNSRPYLNCLKVCKWNFFLSLTALSQNGSNINLTSENILFRRSSLGYFTLAAKQIDKFKSWILSTSL